MGSKSHYLYQNSNLLGMFIFYEKYFNYFGKLKLMVRISSFASKILLFHSKIDTIQSLNCPQVCVCLHASTRCTHWPLRCRFGHETDLVSFAILSRYRQFEHRRLWHSVSVCPSPYCITDCTTDVNFFA